METNRKLILAISQKLRRQTQMRMINVGMNGNERPSANGRRAWEREIMETYLADVFLQTFYPIISDDKPQLQRPKSFAQRYLPMLRSQFGVKLLKSQNENSKIKMLEYLIDFDSIFGRLIPSKLQFDGLIRLGSPQWTMGNINESINYHVVDG